MSLPALLLLFFGIKAITTGIQLTGDRMMQRRGSVIIGVATIAIASSVIAYAFSITILYP